MKALTILAVLLLAGCDIQTAPSSAGIQQATVHIAPQASGMSIEQENVARRLEEDNKPGAIKHLYVISAMSGDVLLYSTVRGKVTSSGKRLKPYMLAHESVQWVQLGDGRNATNEVVQDDGTFGSSVEYIYWWDSKGVYHQHYITGGQIVHVTSAPLRVGKVIINIENESQP